MTAPELLRLDEIIRTSQQDGREGDSYRSPGQQHDANERWAEGNSAVIVYRHDATQGTHSGKTMNRADVNAALARIRAGQTDGIIVAWLDRFSRAPVKDALQVYDDIKAAGGKIVAVDMAGLNPDDPTGEMALTVMLAVGRMQWRKVADRYALSRKDAIADGKAIGGAILGYRFKDPTPTGHGRGVRDSRLVVHNPEHPIAVELFERKAGGATWLELARWLDTVVPKPNGRKWARSTVADLIGRRTYLGEVHHGEFVKAGAHTAIISPALWRHAQSPPGRRTPRGTYLLSGKVRCAGCGRRMRGSKQGRGTNRVYACDTPECTKRSTITVARLDAEVLDQFFAHLDAFHVRAADDAELIAARIAVDEHTEAVQRLASITPTSAVGIAAHQGALTEAERMLAEAEDHLDHLLASVAAGGPDAHDLRADWPDMTLAEQREIIGAGIDAVLVRKASRRTPPHPPISERILVLFIGEAPDGLENGRGPVTHWTWDHDPSTLVASA